MIGVRCLPEIGGNLDVGQPFPADLRAAFLDVESDHLQAHVERLHRLVRAIARSLRIR